MKRMGEKKKQVTLHVKQDPHSYKTMLCVWWGMEGIFHWELLDRNQTINVESCLSCWLHSQQLRQLAAADQQK